MTTTEQQLNIFFFLEHDYHSKLHVHVLVFDALHTTHEYNIMPFDALIL